MHFRNRSRRKPHIDVTNMVDVVLLLVIFFVMTATYSSVSGIKLDLPLAKARDVDVDTRQVVVMVDKEGHFYVKGEPVAKESLGNRLLNAVEGNPERVIVVQADRETPHGGIVTILDTARQLGLSRLAIAAKPEQGARPGR